MSKFGEQGKPQTECKTGRTSEMPRMWDMDNSQRDQNINRKHTQTQAGMRQYAQVFHNGDNS